jgi:serine phosphatase RsbU (regulator of sigma subunit)
MVEPGNRIESFHPDDEQRQPVCATLLDRLQRALFTLTRWARPVGEFARRLEFEILPDLAAAGRERIALDVAPGPSLVRTDMDMALATDPAVPRFLDRLGIRRMELDPRLESNQLTDVLTLLWAHRRALRRARESSEPGSATVRMLLSEDGLHTACTETRFDPASGTLSIRYTYCATRLSRAVARFKRTGRLFRDHRAFFRAAPRLALAVFAFSLVPAFICQLTGSPALRAAVWIGSGLVFAIFTYFFFLTLGSVEYDKEEQAEELAGANRELRRATDLVRSDMRRAREIQENFLPRTELCECQDHLEIATSFRPVSAVGGDYYDFKMVAPHRIAVVFCDVSGHGMSAAFITGLVKTYFRLRCDETTTPQGFVSGLNEELYHLIPPGTFASVFFAILDGMRGMLVSCNAGHSPVPALVRGCPEAPTGFLELETGGPVSGATHEAPYEQQEHRIASGDKLVCVTDGIAEARNPAGELFGTDRLQRVIRGAACGSAQDVCDAIQRAVDSFAEGTPQADDQTMLVIGLKSLPGGQ